MQDLNLNFSVEPTPDGFFANVVAVHGFNSHADADAFTAAAEAILTQAVANVARSESADDQMQRYVDSLLSAVFALAGGQDGQVERGAAMTLVCNLVATSIVVLYDPADRVRAAMNLLNIVMPQFAERKDDPASSLVNMRPAGVG